VYRPLRFTEALFWTFASHVPSRKETDAKGSELGLEEVCGDTERQDKAASAKQIVFIQSVPFMFAPSRPSYSLICPDAFVGG
jgi:hypothetical protein